MKRGFILLLASLLLITLAAPAQDKAAADFKKLGGTVKIDNKTKEIIFLTLGSDKVTDASLKPLADLKSLTKLSVTSEKVTDAGLTGIAKLAKLTDLDLHGTPITDATLEQVADETGVQVCILYSDALDDRVTTYVEMMRFNAGELARCLGGAAGG